MHQSELGNLLTSEFADMVADVEYGKNLEVHLATIESHLEALNQKSDAASLAGEKYEGFALLGYQYYRLRDTIKQKQDEKLY